MLGKIIKIIFWEYNQIWANKNFWQLKCFGKKNPFAKYIFFLAKKNLSKNFSFIFINIEQKFQKKKLAKKKKLLAQLAAPSQPSAVLSPPSPKASAPQDSQYFSKIQQTVASEYNN